MLMLTDKAAEAVRTLVSDAPALSEDAGLRIHAEPLGEDDLRLRATMVAAPAVDDYVLEGEEARVFLEAAAFVYLENKVLDAEIEDDNIRFSLEAQ